MATDSMDKNEGLVGEERKALTGGHFWSGIDHKAPFLGVSFSVVCPPSSPKPKVQWFPRHQDFRFVCSGKKEHREMCRCVSQFPPLVISYMHTCDKMPQPESWCQHRSLTVFVLYRCVGVHLVLSFITVRIYVTTVTGNIKKVYIKGNTCSPL